MDIATISAAIAVRFGASIITAPAGETAIREATAQLPENLGPLPASYVFPPNTGSIVAGSSQRSSVLKFGVDFIREQGVSGPRDILALGNWLQVLVEALIGATQLGGTVASAWIESFELGDITYGGQVGHGIHFVVSVTLTEPINPVS